MLQKLSKPSFLCGAIPLIAIFAGTWLWWNWVSAPVKVKVGSEPTTSGSQRIEVPPGTPGQQIGNLLEKKGLIRSSSAWNLWLKYLNFRDPQGDFKAGIYQLSPSESLETIAQKIWDGEVLQIRLTIPEGWSLQQMATYFEEQGLFSAQEFLAAASEIDQGKYPWFPAVPNAEGFLYPDTYKFASGDIAATTVVEAMLNHFERLALPVYQKQNRTALDLKQWVTLASIVEKEAVVASERELIAGVFTNRLLLGMRLESDPTVEYALGIRQTADQPLTFAQVKVASPYNTYLNPGLPPGPIASPGLASLKATLNPENTDYLFFVARYDGTHVFSRTLAEHEAAVVRIRQQRSR